mmetsp:Transcript_4852/g.5383  ORF Transcript_4852/g.5383 Transcript_4852/m.5383 type:complete len:119 (-) Transcript_4852:160-516(-)
MVLCLFSDPKSLKTIKITVKLNTDFPFLFLYETEFNLIRCRVYLAEIAPVSLKLPLYFLVALAAATAAVVVAAVEIAFGVAHEVNTPSYEVAAFQTEQSLHQIEPVVVVVVAAMAYEK